MNDTDLPDLPHLIIYFALFLAALNAILYVWRKK
jgi:hypothetical protein